MGLAGYGGGKPALLLGTYGEYGGGGTPALLLGAYGEYGGGGAAAACGCWNPAFVLLTV